MKVEINHLGHFLGWNELVARSLFTTEVWWEPKAKCRSVFPKTQTRFNLFLPVTFASHLVS